MDTRIGADGPRELVALVQRRSLAFLPIWAAVAVGGTVESARPGGRALVPLIYVAGFLLFWWLKGLHRRWYGDVRASRAQRARGLLIGMAMVAAFVVMTVVGPRAIPSPVPFAFAVAFAATVICDPWRVSIHWLAVGALLFWMSVVHVAGPEWAMAPWAFPLLTGVAGILACVIDHTLMRQLLRSMPGSMALGATHV